MFENREQAGILLADKLSNFKNNKHVVVLGITRGGVVVAKALSQKLNLSLSPLVVKKIGAPHNPELAIGAVGPKGIAWWDKDLCRSLGITGKQKKEALEKKKTEQKELEQKLSSAKQNIDLLGKRVVLVDDGVATGATVLVAQKFLKKEKAKSIVLATPVVSKDTLRYIHRYFDKVIALEIVGDFQAVGDFYLDFSEVRDEEIFGLF